MRTSYQPDTLLASGATGKSPSSPAASAPVATDTVPVPPNDGKNLPDARRRRREAQDTSPLRATWRKTAFATNDHSPPAPPLAVLPHPEPTAKTAVDAKAVLPHRAQGTRAIRVREPIGRSPAALTHAHPPSQLAPTCRREATTSKSPDCRSLRPVDPRPQPRKAALPVPTTIARMQQTSQSLGARPESLPTFAPHALPSPPLAVGADHADTRRWRLKQILLLPQQPTNTSAGSIDREDQSVTALSNVPHELQLSSAGVPDLLAHKRRAYAEQDWCHPITTPTTESLENGTERAHWLSIGLAETNI